MKTHSFVHPLALKDMNILGGLYAPVAAYWFAEAGFLGAVLTHGERKGVLYVDTHKFSFNKKVLDVDIISYRATVARLGNASITMHIDLYEELAGEVKGEGYATFVTVIPETTESCPHGLILDETSDPEELRWRKEATAYFEKK